MARIEDVWLGDKLNITFCNGQILWIPISSNSTVRHFAALTSGICSTQPKTDGTNIYWQDGPRLSVDDIMCMLEE